MIRFHYSTSRVFRAVGCPTIEFSDHYRFLLKKVANYPTLLDKLLSATFVDSFLIHPIVSDGSMEQKQVIVTLQRVVEAFYGGSEPLDFTPADLVESVQANLEGNMNMHLKVLFFNP